MPMTGLLGPPPGISQVLPPSEERCMIWPNQPEDWEQKMRLGSTGEPFMWKISQPEKRGPSTFHFLRVPSEERIKAPFLVPTRTRTPAMIGLLDLGKRGPGEKNV